MESVKEPEKFIKIAAKLTKKKPVILIKAGRTKSGEKAASSHTGAMSVDDEIFTTACKKANIIRVDTIQEFFDMAKLLAKLDETKGFRLAIVTNAGGPGVIAADAADAYKFTLPKFTEKTINAIKEINPRPSNPLDLIGDAKPIDYRTALKTLQSDQNIDIVYALLTPQSMTNPERVADIVTALNKNKPIVCSFIGGTAVAHPRRHLKENGIAEFETPERGILALARMQEYHKRKKINKNFAKTTNHPRKQKNDKEKYDLKEALELLKKYGIRTPKTQFITKKEEVDNLKIEFPVAIKTAAGLAHKTDYGLVKANIKNKEELKKTAAQMQEKLISIGEKPVLAIQEMINGQEVIISSITTEFGKVITYGLGGIFVEITKDFSQKIAPINETDIEEMLSEVKGTAVLKGIRTKKKYDINSLKKIIKTLSKIALENTGIKEIELNPVMVNEKGAIAVDAVITESEKM